MGAGTEIAAMSTEMADWALAMAARATMVEKVERMLNFDFQIRQENDGLDRRRSGIAVETKQSCGNRFLAKE